MDQLAASCPMSRETIVIEQPTRIFVGRPATPIPADRVEKLAARLSATRDIAAAYLPMIFGLPGQSSPAQVLVIEPAKGTDEDGLRARIGEIVESEAFTPIDVMLLATGHPLLADAAGTGCVVVVRRRARWKFW
jgi:hypothetical protein